MSLIKDVSRYVRSKNAGPFWMTIDVFCDTREDYETIKKSKDILPEKVAALYDVDIDSIMFFFADDLLTVKFSMPKVNPQGHKYESDMHSGQQFVKILDLELAPG